MSRRAARCSTVAARFERLKAALGTGVTLVGSTGALAGASSFPSIIPSEPCSGTFPPIGVGSVCSRLMSDMLFVILFLFLYGERYAPLHRHIVPFCFAQVKQSFL